MELSVIIVNHNTEKELQRCLKSIDNNTLGRQLEIIVLDNNSKDKSISLLKTNFPEIKLIENKANVGFAKAVNQGLRIATCKYLLCLNSDTLVLPSSLNKLLEFMDTHPQAVAAGAKVLNPDGSIQFSCRRFPGYLTCLFNRGSLLTRFFKNNRFSKMYLMSDWPHDEVRQVDWISACYLIMRREAIEKVGLLDERFFMYCEDIDWCYRAKKMGLNIYYVPDAPIIHFNKGYGNNFTKNIIEHHKSMCRFYKKHYSKNFFIDVAVLISVSFRAGFILLLNYGKHLLSKLETKQCIEDMCQAKRIF